MSSSLGFLGICIFVLCMFGIGECYGQSRDSHNAVVRQDIADSLTGTKRDLAKRSLSAAARGLAALQKLITGAKQVPAKSTDIRQYVKPGNSKTARDDFDSVNPRNVKKLNGRFRHSQRADRSSIVQGRIGDREIRLRLGGSDPIIEIVDRKVMSGPYIERIIYKNID